MQCQVCGTTMKNLFFHNSFFCPNDCDKKPKVGKGKGLFRTTTIYIDSRFSYDWHGYVSGVDEKVVFWTADDGTGREEFVLAGVYDTACESSNQDLTTFTPKNGERLYIWNKGTSFAPGGCQCVPCHRSRKESGFYL